MLIFNVSRSLHHHHHHHLLLYIHVYFSSSVAGAAVVVVAPNRPAMPSIAIMVMLMLNTMMTMVVMLMINTMVVLMLMLMLMTNTMRFSCRQHLSTILMMMMRIPRTGLGLGVVVMPSISWIFPTRIPIAMSPTRPLSST